MSRTLAWVVSLEGMLLLVMVVYVAAGELPDTVRFFPYSVLAAGAVMSWRFRRSRLLFGILVLTLADRALFHFGPDAQDAHAAALQAVALLLPVNIGGLALMTERGTLTPIGLRRLALITLQVPLVAILCCPEPVGVTSLLRFSVLPTTWFAWTPVGQPALILFATVLVLLLVRLLLHANATGRGFLWALVASFLALNVVGDRTVATFYFSTGGLILVVSVIEASYFMAFRDSTTGLPARRSLNDVLLSLRGQYTVAIVDVDHFNAFNDQGHEVGDQMLRLVASVIGRVGGGGRAYRYGGEEFAVLFPIKAGDVEPHLERLREAVEEARFTLRGASRPLERPETPIPPLEPGAQLSVTVSIGAAERADRRSAPSEVLTMAAQALYRAKQGGRNRVEMY